MGTVRLAFAGPRPESPRVTTGIGSPGGGTTGEAGFRLRAAFVAALAAGVAARLGLAFLRPLWADEIFTLTVARRPLGALLDALRVDSGPPLHYLAAKLLLLPLPAPGAGDVVVRLLSVAASLLHVPLLIRIGRRRGVPGAGLAAAALFLVFPLAVASGAEGRGYALASLLALASFERLLSLRDAPGTGTAVAAGFFGGAAVLTHYLALLPVGGALLAAVADSRSRGRALVSGGLAAALAGTWIPVALGQPRASMAWAGAQSTGERALQSLANLGIGVPVEPALARFAGPVALLVLVAALVTRRARARVPAAAPLLLALLLLAPLVAFSESALLPDRTALVLLPFVALVLAEAAPALPAAAGACGAVVAALSLPAWVRTTPGAELAKAVAPKVRAGARVVAADLWGPELDYRLAREGLWGRVAFFPAVVAVHPGWYDEKEADAARLAAEADGVVRPHGEEVFFVLGEGTRAGAALLAALPRAGARRVADAGVFEIWLLPPSPRPRVAEEPERSAGSGRAGPPPREAGPVSAPAPSGGSR